MDADITIPDLEEVAANEQLEKVGEVMSIVNNIAIVKGLSSVCVNTASERALDSDTLLVFEDRKIMGYVSAAVSHLALPLMRPHIRYMRLLVLLRSLYIKSGLTKSTLSVQRKLELDVKFSMYPNEATSSLSDN